MRDRVIETIEREKIIVIVRGVEREKLIPFAEAVYAGGVRLMEITYRSDGAVSDDETAANIKMLAEHFNGRMYIGAGTVLKEEQAERTKAAGGTFIISPDTYPAVIQKTRELDMVSVPGALTPSEVQAAHRAGADFVKVFPADKMGPEYIKALKAPLAHIKMLAVGGVNEQNIADYLSAGVSGFGMGSHIVNKEMISNGDFEGIRERASRYTSAVKVWKKISVASRTSALT
jgi:2-dehydro-3-deoxyphosphogluconate aldolase/(4S)-4-hydroxy-2-oxoglutarate aldolase